MNDGPSKVIFWSDNGNIYVTRNFNEDFPEWRHYKRMGWALRYLYGE